jgi:hypothetical protein
MQHEGRREFFNLGTSNKAHAAVVACDIYTFLRANGWEQTLSKFKARSVQVLNADATVGEFLAYGGEEKYGSRAPATSIFGNSWICERLRA